MRYRCQNVGTGPVVPNLRFGTTGSGMKTSYSYTSRKVPPPVRYDWTWLDPGTHPQFHRTDPVWNDWRPNGIVLLEQGANCIQVDLIYTENDINITLGFHPPLI